MTSPASRGFWSGRLVRVKHPNWVSSGSFSALAPKGFLRPQKSHRNILETSSSPAGPTNQSRGNPGKNHRHGEGPGFRGIGRDSRRIRDCRDSKADDFSRESRIGLWRPTSVSKPSPQHSGRMFEYVCSPNPSHDRRYILRRGEARDTHCGGYWGSDIHWLSGHSRNCPSTKGGKRRGFKPPVSFLSEKVGEELNFGGQHLRVWINRDDRA